MRRESLHQLLGRRFAEAIGEVAGRPVEATEAQIRGAGDPKFGDYQCNAAMALAKTLQAKPRDVAQRIVEAVQPALADVVAALEIAGPGFINIRLADAFLAGYLGAVPAAKPGAADRVGIPEAERPQRVVIDYSQPNIAKQMHVGHLRSTIIGDAIARVLGFEGHTVVRQNHIGDWGTQFGMLIRWYRDHPLPARDTHEDVLEAIERDYQAANARFQADEAFATEARRAVAELQGGDAAARATWQAICEVSWDAFTEVYERLGVLLTRADVRGESFYNDQLTDTVAALRTALPDRTPPADAAAPWAVVRDDQGAVCVFLYAPDGTPLFKNPDGASLPMIIQKSDGAYLYATTDLAAIRYRLNVLRADRVIYVTDARQKLHFDMWMAAARAAGWIDVRHVVEHVTFGSVLGEDRRPLKTRAGGTVKLRELLDEAETRARQLLEERGLEESRGQEALIARAVGMAAVKYADLRSDRSSDYVFTWDKMISFQGNTAPYMMYAYARIRSIYRKAAEPVGGTDAYVPGVALRLDAPAERTLALRLARLQETIDVVAADLTPHVLCNYLYDLAAEFMQFYESCPVLKAEDAATRLSRLRLCDLTARSLKLGLGLLGIQVIERM